MKKTFYLFALLFTGAGGLAAQTTLQVVTKNIQKTLEWKQGNELEIICEKAEIEVEPASGNSIVVKAELSARNPSLDLAQNDLEAWKFVTTTIGKKIYIRAYIGAPGGKALPSSNMKAKIKLQAPLNCPISIQNKFGKAKLDRLSSAVKLSGEFCAFSLTELKGSVKVESQYGNVDGARLSGPVEVQSKRADVSLIGLKNSCAIRSEYGSVSIEAGAQTGNIDVDANKSNVTLDTPDPPRHNMQLKASYGDLNVPSNSNYAVTNNGNSKELSFQQGSGRPEIRVKASFGKITLK